MQQIITETETGEGECDLSETTELKTFDYGDGQKIRTYGTPDAPLFAAVDVCGALGIKNNRDALKGLQHDEKITVGLTDANPRNGQPGTLTLITEAGLYTLILRCRSAVTPGTPAYKFRRWVTHEVLPSLRRQMVKEVSSANGLDTVRHRMMEVNHQMMSCYTKFLNCGLNRNMAASMVEAAYAGAVPAAITATKR